MLRTVDGYDITAELPIGELFEWYVLSSLFVLCIVTCAL